MRRLSRPFPLFEPEYLGLANFAFPFRPVPQVSTSRTTSQWISQKLCEYTYIYEACGMCWRRLDASRASCWCWFGADFLRSRIVNLAVGALMVLSGIVQFFHPAL
jgi:hypothetical protein